MIRGNIQRKQLNAMVVLILASFILSGCIRPKSEEVKPTTVNETVGLQPPTFTPPPALTPSTDQQLTDEQALAIQQAANAYFITATGFTLPVANASFKAWYSYEQISPNIITGFIFTNPTGLPCVGVIAYRLQPAMTVFTGGFHCSTDPNAQGVTGQWLLGLDNQQNAIAIGGYSTAPNATAVSVSYATKPASPEPLTEGKFFIINQDYLNFATFLNVSDQGGNTLMQLEIPLNPPN